MWILADDKADKWAKSLVVDALNLKSARKISHGVITTILLRGGEYWLRKIRG
jgi:hypothetical protein